MFVSDTFNVPNHENSLFLIKCRPRAASVARARARRRPRLAAIVSKPPPADLVSATEMRCGDDETQQRGKRA
jgi:hypothetical protein